MFERRRGSAMNTTEESAPVGVHEVDASAPGPRDDDRKAAETVRSRTTLLLALVVLLGAVATAVVSPALAGASEVKLEVNENCHLPDWPCWNVEGNNAGDVGQIQPFTISQGGTVSFEDSNSLAPTDVLWKGTAPSCTPAVPSTPETSWNSTCTFANVGEYEFESQDLFNDGTFNYTKYKVVVAGAPTDATTPASGVTQTGAMLNGSIDPEGDAVEYHFEYEGPGLTGMQSTPTATLSTANFASDPVSAQVSGLEPGMTYNFQLVATYGVGKTPVSGATQRMFTTPAITAPIATTLAAEGLEEIEATLKGTVNPGGEATEYFFEYGTGTGYGQTTGTATLPASGGSQGVSATLKGLAPGTEYHFRLVAKNKLGPAEGLDHSFKTMSPPTKEPTKEPSPTPTPVGGNPAPTPAPAPALAPPSVLPKVEPAGPPLGTLKLAATQHGGIVRGSLVVSSGGSGGRLQIELVSKGATAGKFLRSSLHAGKLTFTLALSAKAMHTLKAHHKLALTVKIVLTPAHGSATTITRSVALRA
jgi:hypothetical protein